MKSLPKIADADRTPVVDSLLDFIGQQNQIIDELSQTVSVLKEKVVQLENELAELKKGNKKPVFPKKSDKSGKKNDQSKADDKRAGSSKRSKKGELKVDRVERVKPNNLPKGSKLKRTRTVVIQDIVFHSQNTQYILEQWEAPDGTVFSASLPKGVAIGSFGIDLHEYIISQYHQCQVTEPLIREQLLERGVDISVGQIHNILTDNKEIFHDEKDEILKAGLEVSSWIQTDDTGARHQGKTGYCTHIGNEYFAWFSSTDSKSRTNFLTILHSALHGGYKIDSLALDYMKQDELPKKILNRLSNSIKTDFRSLEDLEAWLSDFGITRARHLKIVREAVLFSGAVAAGLGTDLIILSDDAGQFNIPLLSHALCWVHEARHIKKLLPLTEDGKKAQNKALDDIWGYYRELKDYWNHPSDAEKEALQAKFDEIFKCETCFASFNLAMSRISKKKDELLMILECPTLPGHNNASEGDIREFVKRRKMSGGTRSASGRQCRDTFASIKKTCRKLGVSFCKLVKDRLSGTNSIPALSQLIREKASENRLSTPATKLA